MNSQKGFIQIPILIAIIIGVVVVGGAGYVGVKQYQNFQIEKAEKDKEARVAVETQQKALEEAQKEIEKLKEESAEAKKKQETLEKKVSSGQQKSVQQNISISAIELGPYLTGVGRIDCSSDWSSFDWNKVSVGSGSLWNIQGMGYSVLTNRHVIDIPKGPYGYCRLKVADNGNIKAYKNAKEIVPGLVTGWDWWLDEENVFRWNQKTDVALLKIKYEFVNGDLPDGLNYTIGSLRLCPQRMALNSPIVAIGFPASTMKVV
jgi:type II secretory pathway pseudopilin PulG